MTQRAVHAGVLALVLTALLGGTRSAPPAVAATLRAAPLTLTPDSGAPGTIVAFSIPAGGLPANDEADVVFQDPTTTYLGLLLFRGMTGPDGSFNARVPMAPEAAAGVGRIFVNAAGNITTSAPFTVRPSIQISPNPVQAGLGIQVVGNGFSSGYPITIQQDNGKGLGPQPLTALKETAGVEVRLITVAALGAETFPKASRDSRSNWAQAPANCDCTGDVKANTLGAAATMVWVRVAAVSEAAVAVMLWAPARVPLKKKFALVPPVAIVSGPVSAVLQLAFE